MTPTKRTWLMACALSAVVAGAAGAAGPTTTFTGTIGDAMCGVTHMVKGDDAACTRACVKGGAAYALIVKTRRTASRSTRTRRASSIGSPAARPW